MILDLIILFFVFSGVLYLETLMLFLASVQLMVILIGIIAAFILVYSQLAEKKWTHAYAVIFYSLAMADLLVLAFLTRNFLVFLLASFFAAMGLLKSVSRVNVCCCPVPDLETYDADEPVEVAATPLIVRPRKYSQKSPVKRGRPPKK